MPGKHRRNDEGDSLEVDTRVLPQLRDTFRDALERVEHQLERAEHDLRVIAWARDPVSLEAAAAFNRRSLDSASAAVERLRAYRDELSAAVHNLDQASKQYDKLDLGIVNALLGKTGILG